MLLALRSPKPQHCPPAPTGSSRVGNSRRELYTRGHRAEPWLQTPSPAARCWAGLPQMQGTAPRFSPRWQMTRLPGPADASVMQHPISSLTPFT